MPIGKINKVKVDLCSYPPYMFLAPRKFGKTTWWRNLVEYVWKDPTKALLIATEDGYLGLDNLNYEAVRAFNSEYDEETGLRGFVQIVDDIVENNGEYGLKAVCIDTLDAYINIATKEVLRQHKKEKGTVCKTLNEAFSGYGRGKARLLDICNEQEQRLRDAGIAVFYLCHTKSKERTDMLSGEKYEQITNNLTDDIYTNFADNAQMVMVGGFDREINSGKILKEERAIYLRGTATIDAGGRFNDLPDKISLNVSEFMDVFENAVKGEMRSGVDKDSIEKTRKAEVAEVAKKAEVAKRKEAEVKANKIDAYRNNEIKESIQPKFASAGDDAKGEFKALMVELGIASLKDVSEVPTEKMEQLAAFWN